MASHMRTARAGLEIIKAFEGFRPRYQRLPNGRWIVGYGHMRNDREGVRISEAEAESILREYDLPPVEQLVTDCVMAPLNQNEFDALVSLAFNLGRKAFANSEVVSALNAGNRIDAANAIEAWQFARIAGKMQVVDALVRRRAAEKALFLKAPGYMAVASSRIVKPLQERRAVPALPEPKEILVERRRAPALPPADDAAVPPIDPLKEASESVRRQMVRILGEDASREQDDRQEPVDASPEEIAAAVSELVKAAEPETGPQKSVWPAREDLPPPPFLDGVNDGPTDPPSEGATSVIDDLEPVDVRPSDIDRALQTNREVEVEDQIIQFNGLLPYLVAAAIGVILFGVGLAGAVGWIGTGQAASTGLGLYWPSITMLVGGLLSIMMVTYLVIALRQPG